MRKFKIVNSLQKNYNGEETKFLHISMYWGADKSLARPGRKQATFPGFYGT